MAGRGIYTTDMTIVTGAEWIVKTDDPQMWKRLEKVGVFLRGDGRFRLYSLAEHQVQLRTRREPRTKEERMKVASAFPVVQAKYGK